MKIYKFKDFLKLPEGTVFCYGERWNFSGLCIKGKSLVDDFLFKDYCGICDHNDDIFGDYESMLASNKSVDINDDYGRDGMYDNSRIFLVYERDDLIKMMEDFICTLKGQS